jgi:transglutaminase-like putative cysteine protease
MYFMSYKFASVISIVFLFTTTLLFAQKSEYNTLTISDSLKENANAIVRLNQIDIVIASQRSMNIKTKRVVTVLNEKGFEAVEAYENYDKSSLVKSILATVYDSFGKEIKKIRRSDFRDQSAVDGGTLFSESRYIYLDYTPIQYPFTVVYECETETFNTAFIPQWMPLRYYAVSVEKSVLSVSYPSNLGFKYKEFNFSNFDVKKTEDSSTQLSYTATKIFAQKEEMASPSFSSLFPKVLLGLEQFYYEGVEGKVKTWAEFGKWYSDNILNGTTDLSEETILKMKTLVGTETDPIKKAQIVYKYMQEKSRYVSIQIGIGGWKPMLASDVDRLGYGDCKALSNYTKALLKAVDVPSYNTLLYGNPRKMDVETDFVSMQGNHMILAVPNKDKYIFLECTSQVDPFGYQGTFTDDRNVLIMKPEGGEIVRTTIYEDKNSTQISKGTYSIAENGDLLGKIGIVSEGSQYNQKFNNDKLAPTEREAFYKDYWSTINNLKINKINFKNDTEKVSFTENAEISALNYGNISANKMMFAVNVFNPLTESIKRIRNRKNPFEIQRGSVDIDEIEIALPANFSIEFLPGNVEINGKFGEYKTEIVKKDNNNIIYKRKFFLKKGLYTNKEYDEFRLFMEQISRNDNAKIILTKS